MPSIPSVSWILVCLFLHLRHNHPWSCNSLDNNYIHPCAPNALVHSPGCGVAGRQFAAVGFISRWPQMRSDCHLPPTSILCSMSGQPKEGVDLAPAWNDFEESRKFEFLGAALGDVL